MKPSPEKLLPIYRAALAKYEADGDEERVRIQKSLIARIQMKSGRNG